MRKRSWSVVVALCLVNGCADFAEEETAELEYWRGERVPVPSEIRARANDAADSAEGLPPDFEVSAVVHPHEPDMGWHTVFWVIQLTEEGETEELRSGEAFDQAGLVYAFHCGERWLYQSEEVLYLYDGGPVRVDGDARWEMMLWGVMVPREAEENPGLLRAEFDSSESWSNGVCEWLNEMDRG